MEKRSEMECESYALLRSCMQIWGVSNQKPNVEAAACRKARTVPASSGRFGHGVMISLSVSATGEPMTQSEPRHQSLPSDGRAEEEHTCAS